MNRIWTHITTTAELATEMLTDREAGHRMVLALWHRSESGTPRADLDVLWAVEGIDALTGIGTILVQSTRAPERHPDWAKQSVSRPAPSWRAGDRLTGAITVVALYTPRDELGSGAVTTLTAVKEIGGANGVPREPGKGLSWRTRMEPVPENELAAWLTRRFDRYGIQLDTVTVLRTFQTRLRGKRAGYPCATVAIDGRIIDHERAITLLNGVGKGKSYGFGLFVPEQ